MAWTTSDIPDLGGRTAVVTGANGGLGLETGRALARAGAHVVMAARDQGKAVEAEKSIRESCPDASLEIVPLDLGSLASVREAADRILAGHERIDILVNNAGLMAIPPPGVTRPHFVSLRALAASLGLAGLSMGMSDDFEAAVEEGATVVRVGSALFGARA